MSMKLEVIINHDKISDKCSIEWLVAATDETTKQERQMLSLVQKALLLQLDSPINSIVVH